MPFNLLEGTQHRVRRRNNGVQFQFFPTPQLYHVAWRCVETCLQCSYTCEEVIDLDSDGDGFLQIRSSKEYFEKGLISELGNLNKLWR